MRILYVSHRFPPNTLGGADIYAYGIAKAEQQRGHQVWVLCNETLHAQDVPKGRVVHRDDTHDGLPVRRLALDWSTMPDPYGHLYVENPQVEQIMFEYMDQIRPDLVHVIACDYVTNAVLTAAHKWGCPTVLTLTGKWHICPVATCLRSDGTLCEGSQPGLSCARCLFGSTKVVRALEALPEGVANGLIEWTSRKPTWFRRAGSLNFIHAIDMRNRSFGATLADVDLVLSASVCHQHLFGQTGVLGRDQIALMTKGVQVEAAVAGRDKTPSQALRFGYTGHVLAHKGADTLVEAFNRLAMTRPAELHIYGHLEAATPFGQRVLALAEGNPAIHWHGRFDNQAIGTKVLANIEVVVMPSNCIENIPRTISEAFAAETPVIGSDTCGVAEQIRHEVDGLLFRRGDASDLAAQMQRCLDEPELVAHLRRGIRPMRSIADEAQELEMRYTHLVAGRKVPVTASADAGPATTPEVRAHA